MEELCVWLPAVLLCEVSAGGGKDGTVVINTVANELFNSILIFSTNKYLSIEFMENPILYSCIATLLGPCNIFAWSYSHSAPCNSLTRCHFWLVNHPVSLTISLAAFLSLTKLPNWWWFKLARIKLTVLRTILVTSSILKTCSTVCSCFPQFDE